MSLKKWLPLIIISPVVLLIDQLSKLWVVNNMILGESRAIIPSLAPYLQFTRSTNSGIAFGLGGNAGAVFIILPILITVLLFWMYAQSKRNDLLQQISLAMIIGGAIGNIIDRVRLDHVIDFVHIFIPRLVSNVSNFADHFIVVGVILLLIDSLLQENKPEQEVDVEVMETSTEEDNPVTTTVPLSD